MNGSLYVVATPIGNYEDMTYRGVRVLSEVDLIYAEDTRVAIILLTKFNITTKVMSMNSYTEDYKKERIIKQIINGMNIALITDAGTPCISDPGYQLVKEAADNGIKIVPVAGACACITGLSASGLPTANFAFHGFLPRKKTDVMKILDKLKTDSPLLAVFYESSLRIVETLENLREAFPEAEAVVCNDLTKRYERFYRGSLSDVINELENNVKVDKGEYTIIIKKNVPEEIREGKEEFCNEALVAQEYFTGNKNMKEAINSAANKYKLSKKDAYNAALELKKIGISDEDE